MQSWLDKIVAYLTSNTLWIYLTLLLFLSYLFMLSGVGEGWGAYFSSFLALCLLYFPVLVYSGFRKWWQRRPLSLVRPVLWIYSFVGHPLLIFFFRYKLPKDAYFFSKVDLSVASPDNFLITIGGLLLLTEIVIIFNDQLLKGALKMPWLESFGLEKAILSLLALLALIASLIAAITQMGADFEWSFTSFLLLVGRFIIYSLQLFVIYLAYYFFYYVNHYLLIPKIFKKKGVIYYGFSLAALILLFYPIFVNLIRYLPIVEQLNLDRFMTSDHIFAEDRGGFPFMIMVLSVPIIIAYEWFRQNAALATLAKEKSATELSLLKQQINPHFFFNTLNNLYALSITHDKQTPEVIMQLSELMRYVIYRGKEETVRLKEEVKYIEDYIQLQQIRLHKKLDFRFEKKLGEEELSIPPLLFIVLVENAFKHGIEPAENECFLHLSLKTTADTLTFSCSNSIEEQSTAAKGIGLTNLRRRLALLYPDQNTLEITESEDRYEVVLQLKIATT